MKIAIPKESCSQGECRVALIPALVPQLVKAGHQVMLEKDAGNAAGYPDRQYIEKGAVIEEDRKKLFEAADAVFMVRGPGVKDDPENKDLDYFHQGQLIIGFFNPLMSIETVQKMTERGVTAMALELIPRISRAQSMDALSSMTNLTGYKSVLLAAGILPKIFPMMMTAAGSLSPAKVFVIGAGVTGLQACATAKRLGALVYAYDVRPIVKEQVESVGAQFVEFDLPSQESEDDRGYANAQSEEFYRKQREEMAKKIADSDVVISTAGVPGKKAPVLITKEMVRGMAPNSVIVDAVAELGGNCELTQPGRTIVAHDVTIIGQENLPSTLAYHASQLLAKNITSLFYHLTNLDGELVINLKEEITVETLICYDRQIINARVREAAGLPPLTLPEETTD